MEQRILTFSKRFTVVDRYGMNFDDVTKKLNESGWIIKQIVSTSFQHQRPTIDKSYNSYPVLVITILVEKPKN